MDCTECRYVFESLKELLTTAHLLAMSNDANVFNLDNHADTDT